MQINIYKTNKTQDNHRFKIYVQKVHHSREHMHSNDYATAESLPRWWNGPAASTPRQTYFQVSTNSHHGSANDRPSLEGYPDAVVHRIQIRRIGWPRLSLSLGWSFSLMQQGDSVSPHHVHDVISLTSTLCHHVRDVRDTNVVNYYTIMISIQLRRCTPKIMKIRANLQTLL